MCLDESAAVSDLGVDFDRDVVTAEMNEGDVLLFNNIIPHRLAADHRPSLCLEYLCCESI